MTIHDPSLRAALKTLKLTGMLDTLDARLAQTRDGKLGHLEFLQVLCEDEIGRRDTAALARRIRRALSAAGRAVNGCGRGAPTSSRPESCQRPSNAIEST